MNAITVLNNNVVLIGDSTEDNTHLTIQKPYSVTQNPEGYLIQPFLQAHTGMEWPEFKTLNSNILTSTKVDMTNPILEQYLQIISGLDVSQPEIILHS